MGSDKMLYSQREERLHSKTKTSSPKLCEFLESFQKCITITNNTWQVRVNAARPIALHFTKIMYIRSTLLYYPEYRLYSWNRQERELLWFRSCLPLKVSCIGSLALSLPVLGDGMEPSKMGSSDKFQVNWGCAFGTLASLWFSVLSFPPHVYSYSDIMHIRFFFFFLNQAITSVMPPNLQNCHLISHFSL